MKKSKIILSIFHLEQNLIHFSLVFFGNRFPVNRNDIITYCGIWEYLSGLFPDASFKIITKRAASDNS